MVPRRYFKVFILNLNKDPEKRGGGNLEEPNKVPENEIHC